MLSRFSGLFSAVQRRPLVPFVTLKSWLSLVDDIGTYKHLVDGVLHCIGDRLELMMEDVEGLDVNVEDGVLTIELPNRSGTYVINKQDPSRQIWFSSPQSGPQRFDYDESRKAWISDRTGDELLSLLASEVEAKVHTKVEFKMEEEE
uniref:ferroxidase n=1 Tax=Stygiella incarcerata TaxID=1712417 RepID=A0A192ZIL1_9EUKA|nr:frataxin [Stygiella incarcerata]